MTSRVEQSDVCIVGAGPAGMILGLLLAQKGIAVTVLESHKDFEREYRGEVLMPRFTRAMQQVGLFSDIEKEMHLKLRSLEMFFKDWRIASVSFAQISPEVPFAVWMPQPVLLNALYRKALTYPNFKLYFSTMVRDVIAQNGKITGVAAEQHGERLEIAAKITVGADGRSSVVRKAADFKLRYEIYNFDLIWFTVKHPQNYDNTVRAFFSPRHNYLILPKYPDAIQCGLIVPPGGLTRIRQQGIEAMRQELLSGHSVLHPFARELRDFHPFHVLQARIDFVEQWAADGCVLIGDAAHTCSPAGAVGVAVAAETAVAAVPVLLEALKRQDYSAKMLGRLQKIREADVLRIHQLQARLTNVIFSRVPGMQLLGVLFLFIMGKLGLLARLQKRIVVG